MSLPSGAKLSHYEILSALGAGGMGEVYRARDTRLDRTVAIKILPEHLKNDVEWRQRFEREARAISSLTHPHICTLHDIGRDEGIDFMVMELIEGETLADRLSRGALPLDEALRYGMQIADALDKAHREGVVHRDLKPGNIMITRSGAKLLDFGLAKLAARAVASRASEFSAVTAAKPLTEEGVVLGTFQYMAPEQLVGKEVDARADIFAFGALLYEMLTGQRALDGESQASLIAAILEHDPVPILELQPTVPPLLEKLVSSCLAKDPDRRLQSANDVLQGLTWVAEGVPLTSVASTPLRRWTRTAAVLVGLGAAALTFALFSLRGSPGNAAVTRFELLPPEGTTFQRHLALSPDGRRLVFGTVQDDGSGMLWLRSLNASVAQPLAGTEGASHPFWSPDSRYVAFFASGKLHKLELESGRIDTLCEARDLWGGSWSEEQGIIFSDSVDLYSVSPAGGTAQRVTPPAGGGGRAWPLWLRGGEHVLSHRMLVENPGIYAGSPDSGEETLILPYGSIRDTTSLARGPDGYLLYVRGGALVAEQLDIARLELSGDPIRIADGIWKLGAGYGSFTASENGVLAYQLETGAPMTRPTWVDRSGAVIDRVGEPGPYTELSLSPDGERLAVVEGEAASADIQLLDVARGTSTRFAEGLWATMAPQWSRDAGSLLFSGALETTLTLRRKRADGGGGDEILYSAKTTQVYPSDSTWDGEAIALYVHGTDTAGWDIGILSTGAGAEPRFLGLAFNDLDMAFSPDGQFAAYVTDESGAYEVYVARLPDLIDKQRVSSAGGFAPRFRDDGRELFYLTPKRELMAVAVETSPSLRIGVPEVLFQTELVTLSTTRPFILFRSQYDVSADGQRFLMNLPVGPSAQRPIHVVINWHRELF